MQSAFNVELIPHGGQNEYANMSYKRICQWSQNRNVGSKPSHGSKKNSHVCSPKHRRMAHKQAARLENGLTWKYVRDRPTETL